MPQIERVKMSDNIIYSLEYLMREAKKNDFKRIYIIIKSALKLLEESGGDFDQVDKIANNDDDIHHVLRFIECYVRASEEQRKNFMEMVE